MILRTVLNRGVMAVGLWMLVAFSCGSLYAHKVSSVSLISYLDTESRTYVLDAAMAVIPSEDQALNDQITPEDAARLFAEEYLVVLFDEEEQESELEIQRINTSDEDTPEELQQQEVVVKMKGTIPEGAKEYLLYLDPTCPMAVVMVVIKDEKPERRMQVVLAGEYSRPVNIQPLEEGDPFEKESQTGNASSSSENSKNEGDGGDGGDGGRGSFVSGWMGIMDGSLLLILLPAGVLLLTTKGWPVVYQVAAILIGQSMMVSFASSGLVPAGIPASQILGVILAFVAFETLAHRKLRWWRLAALLVAGALGGILLSLSPDFRRLFADQGNVDITGLILYVTGAELAVVVISCVAAALCLFLSRFDWYEKSLVQPLAVLLGAYGIFEAIAKLF